MLMLNQCGTNLTKLVDEGKLDPVIGRQKQMDRVIQIMGRRRKNNPCLIGEPGVGKTAIVEGIAQRIAKGDVPETLEGKKVISLDMGLVISNTTYRGQFEDRLTKMLEEIRQSGDIILFIEEVHTLVGTGRIEGSALDATNILKPALARGELQCIGATTLEEYRRYIEKDPALERRFQPVVVPEPTVDETVEILKGLREQYEIHHRLRYTDEALEAAARLSDQYINDRFLPDKAIDLVDEAGSHVRVHVAQVVQPPKETRVLEKVLKQITKERNEAASIEDFEKEEELRDQEIDLRSLIKTLTDRKKASPSAAPTVTEVDIQQIVSLWTGIPIEKVSVNESIRLLSIEETLHTRIIGQAEAVKAISRAIRRACMGLRNPNRPIASFLFSGPTGVGKTELSKALSSVYFGSEEAMIRLDMSEYMEHNSVSKLIGTSTGYDVMGGQLTEAVCRRAHTVVLFDEIEKAHPDVFNLMLQILEDGRLTDTKGRTVDFKNTLLIMTSNVGSSVIEKDSSNELNKYLYEIIVFRQLTKPEIKEIGRDKEIELEVTERFKDKVVDEGYNPSYGARPLRRAITRLLEDCMAEEMLRGEIKEGDSVIVDVDGEGYVTVLKR
ncbi:ATP-dependent Clp protease ATP-binding subunit ClpA cd4a [Ranunculus cassubicifolius]